MIRYGLTRHQTLAFLAHGVFLPDPSQFPIHAAGYHSRGSEPVLDRVISSYSSSAKTLVQNRQKRVAPAMELRMRKAAVVGIEKTQGLKNLLPMPVEMGEVEHLCSFLRLQVCKSQPYWDDVLAALNDCDMFHFSGHGQTD